MLKNSFLEWSLLSLDCSFRSSTSGAWERNLLKSFFFPMSASRIKLPITEFCVPQCFKSLNNISTGFCVSKCFKSLNNKSTGFWFFIIFFEMGSSFCLKLASFNLLLVTYKLISSWISWPNSLVASKNLFTSSLGAFFTISCWMSVSLEKSILSYQSL